MAVPVKQGLSYRCLAEAAWSGEQFDEVIGDWPIGNDEICPPAD